MIVAHQFASSPDPFGPKPDGQPDPDRIQAGFAQYDLGQQWENATESETGKLVAGQLYSRLDDSCSLACFQTRFVWAKPGHLDLIRISFV